MILNLLKKELKDISCQSLIVFTKSSAGKDRLATIANSDLSKKYASLLEEKTISGKALEAVTIREANFGGFRNLIFIGLGEDKDLDQEGLRQAAAAAYDALKALKVKEAIISFDGVKGTTKEAPSFVKALAEGLTLASYSFDQLKSKKAKVTTAKAKSDEESEGQKLQIHVVSRAAQEKSVKAAFQEGIITAECVNFARYLGDMPGNLMTPKILAEEAQKAAQGTKIKVTVWDKNRIIKEKMGGLLGVSLGSSEEPRFIIMEYKGGKTHQKPLIFVGKGLTFDSGGISIKPSAGMEEMKFDMCGGANVIGTMLAAARLKLDVNLIGLVPSTENMPGPSANKPGDVCFARNGKSFEVNNTDAEGRLILADALSYASEQDPGMIIDAATLTGAMVVALGNIHTGYFTRDKELKTSIEKAAKISGELVWNMPLTDQHLKDMKGTYADLSNMSAGKGAGSATATAFLEQFVGEGIPWAHFDIAGTGWAVGNRLNYCTKKGASGVMLRTFVELAKSYE
ncbi:MAG: leucyl aminopeptidase [Bdellovibrionales bacterium]|nr:leucyl aminopeptidase [Bdellovibrionales bacterium]